MKIRILKEEKTMKNTKVNELNKSQLDLVTGGRTEQEIAELRRSLERIHSIRDGLGRRIDRRHNEPVRLQ